MQSVCIDGNEVLYLSKEDVYIENKDVFYISIYKNAELICEKLNIECPNITTTNTIRRFDEKDNSLYMQAGITYSPDEVPGLDKYFVIMSTEIKSELLFLGDLAHELRHIWQNIYNPDINEQHAIGFADALYHEAEIDADAFAIFYLSMVTKVNIETIASEYCKTEKELFPTAYEIRIQCAKEISREMNSVESKPTSDTRKEEHSLKIIDWIKNMKKSTRLHY